MDSQQNAVSQLNGEKCTEKKIKETVAALHVQVDNLCQFLPQDKVAAFSSLDSKELLVQTQRALERDGFDPLAMQTELIELNKGVRKAALEIATRRAEVEKLEALQRLAEADVLRFKQREKLKDEVLWLRKKLPWMKFETLRARAVALKDELAAQEKELDELKAQLAPFDARIAQASNDYRAAGEATKSARTKLSTVQSRLARLRADYEKVRNGTVAEQTARKRLESDGNAREAKIRALDDLAVEKRSALAVLVDRDPDLQRTLGDATHAARNALSTIDSLHPRIAATKNARARALSRVNELRAQLGQISDRQMQKRKRLMAQKGSERVVNAYDFIRNPANAARFERKVYGPVCMEIDATDSQYVNAIEASIASYLQFAFVVQSEADRRTLRQLFKVNVLFASAVQDRGRRVDDRTKAAVRINKWMDEVVECDPVVMNALNIAINLSTIAICADNASPEAVSAAGVSYFYLGGAIYTANRSRYGARAITLKIRDVSQHKPRVLSLASGGEAEVGLKSEIDLLRTGVEKFDHELQDCEKQTDAANVLLQNKRNAAAAVTHNRGARERAERELSSSEEQLREMREISVDGVEARRAALAKKIGQWNLRSSNLVREVTQVLEELVEASRAVDMADVRKEALAERQSALKTIGANIRRQFSDCEARTLVKRNEYDEAKRATKDQKATAEQLCQLTQEVRDRFLSLPDSETDVQQLIDEKESLMSVLQTGSNVLREYQARQTRLESELRPALAAIEDANAAQSAKLTALHEKWRPMVLDIAGRLNTSFSRFMRELGCAGEVAIEENAEDYAQWELQIRVTFRNNEPLQTLSANVQSGGERSVSTMLFLISMQDLADCPFRLVDEINQGMDPRNERAIFSLVVAAATRPKTPQYFLITPKLLPDLDYNEATTVLCVFNGAFSVPQDDVDVDTFIDAAEVKRRRVDQHDALAAVARI